jgi:hypothetical protein
MGIVYTTANRNWELHLALVEDRLRQSRALAVDMESATVAANGFRYRIPTATLLAVSDKPLHAQPKLSADAQDFYAASRRQHVEIAISVTEKVRQLYPGGLPAADLRSADEPLLGTTDPEPTQASSPVGQPQANRFSEQRDASFATVVSGRQECGRQISGGHRQPGRVGTGHDKDRDGLPEGHRARTAARRRGNGPALCLTAVSLACEQGSGRAGSCGFPA